MTEFAPYPHYKDSGLPWIGRIPAHWDACKLKYIAKFNPSRSEISAWQNQDISVSFVPMKCITTYGKLQNVEKRKINEVWNGFTYFQKNDIVLAKISPCFENGKGGLLDALPTKIGFGTTEFIVLRATQEEILPAFLALLLSLKPFRILGAESMTGAAGQQRVPLDFVKNFPVPVPPRSEQDQIAHYLRTQDAKIARFIRIKRALIERLKEQKLRLIDHVVTGGLDMTSKRKPSGVAWLGDVPGHWEVLRLKRVCRFNYGDALAEESRRSGEISVYGSNGKVGAHDTANACGPCIVIGRKGSFGKVNYSEHDVFAIDTAFYIDHHCTKVNIRWLYYLLLWCRLDSQSKDSAVPGLHREDAHNIFVPVCGIQEQEQIAAHLDTETVQIETAITQSEQEITLIREYRERLIADAVTGQIDLRGWQPSADDLTFEDDSLAALADDDAPDTPEDARDEDD